MVWPVVFIFVCYLSAMSRKLEDDGKTPTTTLPPATHFPYKQNKSTCNFPNPIGRQAHANFTMTKWYSGLSRSA